MQCILIHFTYDTSFTRNTYRLSIQNRINSVFIVYFCLNGTIYFYLSAVFFLGLLS